MSARGEAQLWVAQRVTAVILAVCVAVHLVTIIYAVRSGLGGAELLGRTRGSVGIAVFYGVFVIAASIHGAIGLRAIGIEWLRLRPHASGMFAFVLALALAALGMRAVFAVVAA
jgi:succinate dehydrogenase subunit C